MIIYIKKYIFNQSDNIIHWKINGECFESLDNCILTSNYFDNLNNEPLKIFKFSGEKVKSISDSIEITIIYKVILTYQSF